MEALNLQWLRKNQKTIRAELYGGLADALQAGDIDASQLGKRTVLPATHTGSPRSVAQNYQVWQSYHMTFLASFYTSASSYNAKSPNLIQGQCARGHVQQMMQLFDLSVA